jgi:hypothetical protein
MDPFLGTDTLRLGVKDTGGPGKHSVSALQAELVRVGVLQGTELFTKGLFDSKTDTAVRRFQWFASHVPGCLARSGAFIPRRVTRLAVDGVVGPHVKAFLNVFRTQVWTVTGMLVTVDMGKLSRINPNSGFSALVGDNRNLGLCERGFVDVLTGMNRAAEDNNIYVFVNQMFRVEGNSVSGAVVPPATSSAHKIGRAIDLQLGTGSTIVAGSNPQLSTKIKTAIAGTAFYKFREHAKKALACRYGGDFSATDPPHFDRQIHPGGSEVWKFHYYFDQLQYQQAQDNHAAIPDAQQ